MSCPRCGAPPDFDALLVLPPPESLCSACRARLPPSFRSAAPLRTATNDYAIRQQAAPDPRLPPSWQSSARVIPTKPDTTSLQPKNAEDELEDRLASLRGTAHGNQLGTSDLEERLAALRGVPVDIVRNPRLLFQSSASRQPETSNDILERAVAEAALPEWDRYKDLEVRWQKYKSEAAGPASSARPQGDKEDGQPPAPAEEEDDEQARAFIAETERKMSALKDNDDSKSRLSSLTVGSNISENTLREVQSIGKLLSVAEQQAHDAEQICTSPKVKRSQRELQTIMAGERQRSKECERITNELSNFWQRCGPSVTERDLRDSESDSDVDEETIKRIVQEAERAVDEEETCVKKSVGSSETCPPPSTSPSKKSGFLRRLFHK